MEISLKILSDYLLSNGFICNKAIKVIKIDGKMYNVGTSHKILCGHFWVSIDTWTKRNSDNLIVGVIIASRYKHIIHDVVYTLNLDAIYEIEGLIEAYIPLSGKSIKCITRDFNLSRIFETLT